MLKRKKKKQTQKRNDKGTTRSFPRLDYVRVRGRKKNGE
jgi:hypothetical protein